MPIYRFKCPMCGELVESFVELRNFDNVAAHPRCEHCDLPMKRMAVPAKAPAVHFHGDGFTKSLE